MYKIHCLSYFSWWFMFDRIQKERNSMTRNTFFKFLSSFSKIYFLNLFTLFTFCPFSQLILCVYWKFVIKHVGKHRNVFFETFLLTLLNLLHCCLLRNLLLFWLLSSIFPSSQSILFPIIWPIHKRPLFSKTPSFFS